MLKDVRYCICNAFQIVFVYFMFPETSGRTLEELTFCESTIFLRHVEPSHGCLAVYEDEQEVVRDGEVERLREHGETVM